MHLRGKPVLIDSGMPFYFGPRDWVDHFRGASAHNTVEIEGLPVVRHSGRLGWSHVSKSMQLAGREDSRGVIVSGCVHLGGGNSITRSVRLISGDGIWIVDLIETDQPREVRWYWQMHHSLAITTPAGGATGLCCGDLRIAQWSPRGGVGMVHERADADRPVAWRCSEYGRRMPGARITSHDTAAGRRLVVTYIGVNPPRARVRFGEFELLCAGSVADEGVDCPEIDLTPLPFEPLAMGPAQSEKSS